MDENEKKLNEYWDGSITSQLKDKGPITSPDRYHECMAQDPRLAKCPTMTQDFFAKFENVELEKLEALEKMGFTADQKAVIRDGLNSYPGSSVLEVIAHHLTKSPWFGHHLALKLSGELRREMAEEADHAGEGMYDAKNLLEKSDEEIAEAYLDALRAYAESQLGY